MTIYTPINIKKYFVYIIQNKLDLKIYIGRTSTPEKRFGEHIRGASPNSLIYRAINKYGKNNFIFNILEENYNYSECCEAEDFYISYFNTCSREYGYNILTENFSGYFSLYKPTGSKNPNSKLNEKQVLEIYDLYVNHDYNTKDLEMMYNISDSTVNGILDGTNWRSLNLKPIYSGDKRRQRKNSEDRSNKKFKLNENQVLEIRELNKLGYSNVALSKKFNISSNNISSIVLRKIWKHIL